MSGAPTAETPPMSHRFVQVAKSGSSPIEQCRRRGQHRAGRSRREAALRQRVVGHGPPDRRGAASGPAGRAARRAPRRPAGAFEERHDLVRHVHVAEGQPAPPHIAHARASVTTAMSVTSRPRWSSRARPASMTATWSSRSSERTSQVSPRCVDGAGWAVPCALEPSTVPTTRRSRPRPATDVAPPVERMSARSLARRRSVQNQPRGRHSQQTAVGQGRRAPRARWGRRAGGRPRSPAPRGRPHRCGAEDVGLDGSKTVASTGRPSSASGWLTR